MTGPIDDHERAMSHEIRTTAAACMGAGAVLPQRGSCDQSAGIFNDDDAINAHRYLE